MLLHSSYSTIRLIFAAFGVALSMLVVLGQITSRFDGLNRFLQHIMKGMPSAGLATLLLLLFAVVWPVLPAGGDSRLSQHIMPSLVIGVYLAAIVDPVVPNYLPSFQVVRTAVCQLSDALWKNLSAFAATIILTEWLFSRAGVGYSFLDHLWGHELREASLDLFLLWGICVTIAMVLDQLTNRLKHP